MMSSMNAMTKDEALIQAKAAHAAGLALFQVQLALRANGIKSADEAEIIQTVFGVKLEPLTLVQRGQMAALRGTIEFLMNEKP